MGKAFELAESEESAEATIGTLQNLWGNIYREIADVSVSGQEIVRVTATLHYGPYQGKPQKAEQALELLRDECDTADKPRQIAEKIYDVTKKLVALEKNIFLGPMTKVLQARILAVALESADCLTVREREKALAQWECVTFRIFGLHNKDARTKVGDYIRLAAKIANKEDGASRYSEIMGALRELGDDYPISDAVQEGLVNSDCYDRPDLCRYVLWRYEEHLARRAGRGATVDEQIRRDVWQLRAVDSIEHIFPQIPERGGAWDGKMQRGDGKVKEHWRHVGRIGNLILLPISLNWEAKRTCFEDKKAVYERHNLRMVREILEENQWTLAEIEDRESKIVDWAIEEWADQRTD
tara:strand:- start:316 stop:1374 length:1059 start_codon:yes stop_codon:yes gene_type:complete